MSEESEPQWYCIHTKPKCEHIAAATVKQLGEVETFCPRLRFQRSTPRGRVWFVEALFPSYFFAKFLYTEYYRGVKHAHNVIRIVDFGSKPIPIPESTIEALREEMQGKEVREVQHGVQAGDTVEVSEGPMRGLKGIVESVASGADRVRVLLEFLGRTNVVDLPASKVLNERAPRDVFNGE